jgi:hypothetical protein
VQSFGFAKGFETMEESYDNIEFIDEKPEIKLPKKGLIKEWLDGSVLTREAVLRQLPFILFLTLLAFIYIGNRYHAEKLVRRANHLHRELRDLRAQAITTSAELMHISRQSEVLKLVRSKDLELKESMEPPKKIVVKK